MKKYCESLRARNGDHYFPKKMKLLTKAYQKSYKKFEDKYDKDKKYLDIKLEMIFIIHVNKEEQHIAYSI